VPGLTFPVSTTRSLLTSWLVMLEAEIAQSV
jgi:hypothetical protein